MIESYTRKVFTEIHEQMKNQFIVGHDELLRKILVAYLCRGHVLIEGPPGTAKTLTAKLLAHLLSRTFRRIQFTSDLLPGDILGSFVYAPDKREFQFIKGPLFSDFIVADEINRTPPRTQSALLEAMEERQVTVEGQQFTLNPDFFVIATQNPQDHEGTFLLPEVQMDRFLIKVNVEHANAETETRLLSMILNRQLPPNFGTLKALQLDRTQVDAELALVKFDASLLAYVAALLQATRKHPALINGASLRGGIALMNSARMAALIEGRDFVIPDDIKALAADTLGHRIRCTPESRLSNVTEYDILAQILKTLPFPKN